MRSVALVGLAVTAVACGESRPASPAVVVRDSAGVEIVENVRPSWTEAALPTWRVGEDPIVRIGVEDGDPAYQFSMVVGAARLDGDRLAVADAGSQEVRFFGPDGAHVRTTGGTGGGPGEFTGLAGLGPAPHGVWAYDFPLRRVTLLDASGAVTGLDPLPPEPATLNAVGMLPDGSLVLRQLWGARAVAGAAQTGLRRDEVAYVRFAAGGSLDTLALAPGREVHVASEGGRGVMMTPLFPHNSVGAVKGGRVVIGSQDRFTLWEYGPNGEPVRHIRLPDGDLAITDDDIRDYIDRYVQGVEPERRPGIRAVLDGMPAPEARPAHGELLADRLGYVWVAEWTVHGETPRSWTVVDPTGRWLGTVHMPPGFRPTDISREWVVGVERDAVDVEYVVVYSLERNQGAEG